MAARILVFTRTLDRHCRRSTVNVYSHIAGRKEFLVTTYYDRLSAGERIWVARHRVDVEQQELAAAIGARQGTVSDWETKGAIPGGKYLELTARFLGERGVNPAWVTMGALPVLLAEGGVEAAEE